MAIPDPASPRAMFDQAPLLLIAWAAWCLLHSLLASRQVKRSLHGVLHLSPRQYRLAYVLFSTLSVTALLAWQLVVLKTPPPAGYAWQILRMILGAYGFFMLAAGSRTYDMGEFLGLANPETESGAPLHFRRDGILGHLRHPWYSGGIALVAAVGETPLDRWDWRLLLILYLAAGCFIEEKRLVAELGDIYRQYQQKVPMLIPRFKPVENENSEGKV